MGGWLYSTTKFTTASKAFEVTIYRVITSNAGCWVSDWTLIRWFIVIPAGARRDSRNDFFDFRPWINTEANTLHRLKNSWKNFALLETITNTFIIRSLMDALDQSQNSWKILWFFRSDKKLRIYWLHREYMSILASIIIQCHYG